jgi:hypothetical protein
MPHQVYEHPVVVFAGRRGTPEEALAVDVRDHYIVQVGGLDVDPEIAGLADVEGGQG